eukprot:SAG31_NODE_1430_length_8385_cov_3.096186_7_plen_179_part_00
MAKRYHWRRATNVMPSKGMRTVGEVEKSLASRFHSVCIRISAWSLRLTVLNSLAVGLADSGLTWNLAQLDHPELEHSHAPKQNAKWWCWCFFQYEVETISLLQCKELRCRAWDEASNCQPANLTWNVMGMGNNPHFRVEIHPETLPSGGFGLRFVHPTTAGPTSAPDGTTTSGGCERL